MRESIDLQETFSGPTEERDRALRSIWKSYETIREGGEGRCAAASTAD